MYITFTLQHMHSINNAFISSENITKLPAAKHCHHFKILIRRCFYEFIMIEITRNNACFARNKILNIKNFAWKRYSILRMFPESNNLNFHIFFCHLLCFKAQYTPSIIAFMCHVKMEVHAIAKTINLINYTLFRSCSANG